MPKNDTTNPTDLTFALSIFPRCDHGLVRGEGTPCGALAHYRIGNCFYCAEHRDQPRVRAYPIAGNVSFGFPESMNFDDLCAVVGKPEWFTATTEEF